MAINPDDANAWQELGFAYLSQAFRVGDPSFYGLAEGAFERTDELVPSDPRTLLGQGALALALHRFPEALELGRLQAMLDLAQALDGTAWFSVRHHDRLIDLAAQLGVTPPGR